MQYWTIEVHENEAGAWVGLVKRRPHARHVRFMSDYHCAALFAFTECQEWIRATQELEAETSRLSEDISKATTIREMSLAS